VILGRTFRVFVPGPWLMRGSPPNDIVGRAERYVVGIFLLIRSINFSKRSSVPVESCDSISSR
jgi:hypothetical protein